MAVQHRHWTKTHPSEATTAATSTECKCCHRQRPTTYSNSNSNHHSGGSLSAQDQITAHRTAFHAKAKKKEGRRGEEELAG
jgi:uncharacterized protein CbrC (UPF0167 family)